MQLVNDLLDTARVGRRDESDGQGDEGHQHGDQPFRSTGESEGIPRVIGDKLDHEWIVVSARASIWVLSNFGCDEGLGSDDAKIRWPLGVEGGTVRFSQSIRGSSFARDTFLWLFSHMLRGA